MDFGIVFAHHLLQLRLNTVGSHLYHGNVTRNAIARLQYLRVGHHHLHYNVTTAHSMDSIATQG